MSVIFLWQYLLRYCPVAVPSKERFPVTVCERDDNAKRIVTRIKTDKALNSLEINYPLSPFKSQININTNKYKVETQEFRRHLMPKRIVLEN